MEYATATAVDVFVLRCFLSPGVPALGPEAQDPVHEQPAVSEWRNPSQALRRPQSLRLVSYQAHLWVSDMQYSAVYLWHVYCRLQYCTSRLQITLAAQVSWVAQYDVCMWSCSTDLHVRAPSYAVTWPSKEQCHVNVNSHVTFIIHTLGSIAALSSSLGFPSLFYSNFTSVAGLLPLMLMLMLNAKC